MPNPPINAVALLRAVVGQLVTRIINPTTTRELISGIDRDATEELSKVAPEHRRSETQLERAQRELGGFFQFMGQSVLSSDQLAEIRQLGSGIETLQSEVQSTREGMDRLTFIGDEEELMDSAQDLRTYLDYAEPGDTRKLMGIFIEDILSGSKSL